MKKQIWFAPLLILVLALALTACGLLQEPEEASAPIEAIPLATQSAGVATSAPAEATEAPAEATAAPAEPTAAPAEATVAPTEEPAAPAGTAQVYTIDSAASQVRFEIGEDLRGARNNVVGTTDQVAGQISVNLADLSQTEVGIIQINARTLVTDNDFRNRAIANEILDTGDFEFITFTPTSVEGLPASATIGEAISFSIVGDLTIRDITMPATFNVEATAVSETQITGTATVTVNRADFGLQIPSVPSVANVDEQVQLFIDFTANAS